MKAQYKMKRNEIYRPIGETLINKGQAHKAFQAVLAKMQAKAQIIKEGCNLTSSNSGGN